MWKVHIDLTFVSAKSVGYFVQEIPALGAAAAEAAGVAAVTSEAGRAAETTPAAMSKHSPRPLLACRTQDWGDEVVRAMIFFSVVRPPGPVREQEMPRTPRQTALVQSHRCGPRRASPRTPTKRALAYILLNPYLRAVRKGRLAYLTGPVGCPRRDS